MKINYNTYYFVIYILTIVNINILLLATHIT